MLQPVRQWVRRYVPIATIATSLALGRAAFAQPSATDAALATELFNTGRDLMKDGQFVAACPKLSESVRLDPKVGPRP